MCDDVVGLLPSNSEELARERRFRFKKQRERRFGIKKERYRRKNNKTETSKVCAVSKT